MTINLFSSNRTSVDTRPDENNMTQTQQNATTAVMQISNQVCITTVTIGSSINSTA